MCPRLSRQLRPRLCPRLSRLRGRRLNLRAAVTCADASAVATTDARTVPAPNAPPYVGTTTACVSADKGDGLYRLAPAATRRGATTRTATRTSGGPWTPSGRIARRTGSAAPLKYALPNSPTESYSHVNADFLDVQRRPRSKAARFYCVTSNHDRVLHFMSNNSKVLKSVWQGGAPSSRDDWLEFEALEGTALLPAITERAGFAGTASLSWYPFWRWNHVCWSIKGIDNRRECGDKYSKTRHNTTHQIWARLSPADVATDAIAPPDAAAHVYAHGVGRSDDNGCSDHADLDPAQTAVAMTILPRPAARPPAPRYWCWPPVPCTTGAVRRGGAEKSDTARDDGRAA